MKAPKIITMVRSLGPWNPEWRHAHGYSNGESSRSFHRGCSEFPDLIKQEISFLKNQYWRTERIFFLTAMYNIIQHEDMKNGDVLQLLRDSERKVWWWEEQDFIRINNLRGAEDKEPSIEELRIQYKNDISKSIRYIPIDMYVAWIEAQILPRQKFEDH